MLLHKHLPGVEVWAYASRVNGRSHDGSDLDLVLRGPKLAEIDISRLADFTEALQDSTIPFLVEVRDWARLPESFHHEIEREHVVLVAASGEAFAERNAGMVSETIADFVDIVMGQSPPGGTVSGGVGLPLLNGPTEFGPHHPTPIQFTTDARKIAHPGDLLFCVRGSTTGRMNWADQEYAIGRGVAAIRHRCASELQPSFARSSSLNSPSCSYKRLVQHFLTCLHRSSPQYLTRASVRLSNVPSRTSWDAGRQDRVEPADERDAGGDGTVGV